TDERENPRRKAAGGPGPSARTRAAGEVDIAVAVAVVLPDDVADAAGTVPGDGQPRAGLLARARAAVVHPLRGRERRAAVGAGREEGKSFSRRARFDVAALRR